jgi:hypothetical protein
MRGREVADNVLIDSLQGIRYPLISPYDGGWRDLVPASDRKQALLVGHATYHDEGFTIQQLRFWRTADDSLQMQKMAEYRSDSGYVAEVVWLENGTWALEYWSHRPGMYRDKPAPDTLYFLALREG